MAETRPRGLGLGLSALLGDAPPPADERLIEIPLDQLRPNARQPRAHFDESELAELVASITHDGVLQPVLVRPAADGAGYELIAGERRWRAARAAGLSAVPAIVRDADDREALALAVVENVVRTDLDPIEEARAYARLCDEMGLTQAEVAQRTGGLVSKAALANYETGHRSLRVDVLWVIAGALGEDLGSLLSAAERGVALRPAAGASGSITVDVNEVMASADPRLGPVKRWLELRTNGASSATLDDGAIAALAALMNVSAIECRRILISTIHGVRQPPTPAPLSH